MKNWHKNKTFLIIYIFYFSHSFVILELYKYWIYKFLFLDWYLDFCKTKKYKIQNIKNDTNHDTKETNFYNHPYFQIKNPTWFL